MASFLYRHKGLALVVGRAHISSRGFRSREPSPLLSYVAKDPSKEQPSWKRLAEQIKDGAGNASYDATESVYAARLRTNHDQRDHVEKIEQVLNTRFLSSFVPICTSPAPQLPSVKQVNKPTHAPPPFRTSFQTKPLTFSDGLT